MSRLGSLRNTALTALFLLGVGGWAIYHRVSQPAPYVRHPLGEPLPDVVVQRPNGSQVPLLAHLGHRPALLYVFSAAQCASCSNLGLEFRILRSAYPNLRTVVVGSGSSAAEFRESFEAQGVAEDAVVDPTRELLHALHVQREPLVLLTDSTGRVVFVDPRTPSQAAQYPMGRVLRDIQGALGTPRPESVR